MNADKGLEILGLSEVSPGDGWSPPSLFGMAAHCKLVPVALCGLLAVRWTDHRLPQAPFRQRPSGMDHTQARTLCTRDAHLAPIGYSLETSPPKPGCDQPLRYTSGSRLVAAAFSWYGGSRQSSHV